MLGLIAHAALSDAAPAPPYTKDYPYYIPAESNGLAVEKPNILFMPDQLRFDAVGCFGNSVSVPLPVSVYSATDILAGRQNTQYR